MVHSHHVNLRFRLLAYYLLVVVFPFPAGSLLVGTLTRLKGYYTQHHQTRIQQRPLSSSSTSNETTRPERVKEDWSNLKDLESLQVRSILLLSILESVVLSSYICSLP